MTTQTETQIIDVKAKLDPSLQALVDVLKSTTANYRQLKDSLLESAKAGKVTEEEFKKVSAALEKFSSSGKSSAKDVSAAEKAMTGWAASMKQLEGSMATLPTRIDAVKTALAGMRAVGDTSSGTYKANVVALRSLEDQMSKFDAVNTGSIKGWKEYRFAIQNAAYQLTDMTVSLKGGQNAAMVMAQQLPQLISGIGGAGFAAAGLAATLLAVSFAPVITQIQEFLDYEKKFKDGVKSISDSVKDMAEGIKEVDMDAWIKSFNGATEAGQKFLIVNRDLNAMKTADTLEKTRQALEKMIPTKAGDLFTDLITKVTAANVTLGDGTKATTASVAEMSRALTTLNLTSTEDVLGFLKQFGPLLNKVTSPALREVSGNFLEYARTLLVAKSAQDAMSQTSAAAPGQRLAQDIEKQTAAYKQLIRTKQEEADFVPKQITALKELLALNQITPQVYKEQMEALTKTKGQAEKLNKELERLREEWAKLVGKSDPIKAFVDAVKQAEELRKKVKGSVEDLALVYDGLIKTRNASLQKLIDEKTIEDFARLYGVSEDTAKSLINLKKKAGEASETLKVMAQAMQSGDVAFAQQIADSLDLKVLPAAERSASAFRRLKADAAKQADIQIGFEDWLKTAEAISATTAQVMEVGKATGAVVPNVYKIQEAWEKMANDRNGLIKTREEVEAFIATQRSLGQMTDELAEKLRNTFGVNTQTLVESMTIAVGQTLANGVSNFVDVLTESGKSFREWAADLIKEIGKVMIKLAALAAFKTFTKGTAFEGLLGKSLSSGSNVIPFPVSPSPAIARFTGDSGVQPLVRFGTPASPSTGTDSATGQNPVNITVNNTMSDTAKVEVAETQRPDGTREISVLIRKEVRAMLGDGSTDSLMRSNYGLRRAAA